MLVRRRAYLRRKPSQDRSSFTFEAILDAAQQVILAEGLKSLQMAGLGRRAGVSNGSLYQYFPDRLAVLMALSDRMFARFTQELRLLLERLRDAPLTEFLEQLAEGVVDSALRDQRLRMALREPLESTLVGERVDWSAPFARALTAELARRSPGDTAQLATIGRSLIWVADGLLDGALREPEVSARDLAEALRSAWRGLAGGANGVTRVEPDLAALPR